MLTLYSYPSLFGVADNNGYGLKVFAFLRLAAMAFRHENIFDASKAPRGQLPYIVDGDDVIDRLTVRRRARQHRAALHCNPHGSQQVNSSKKTARKPARNSLRQFEPITFSPHSINARVIRPRGRRPKRIPHARPGPVNFSR